MQVELLLYIKKMVTFPSFNNIPIKHNNSVWKSLYYWYSWTSCHRHWKTPSCY